MKSPEKTPNAWLVNTETKRSYALRPTDTRIGRAMNNDVVVDDHTVSRQHALVRHQNGAFLLIALEAQMPLKLNNFIVNGQRSLQHGDEILIGETVFQFIVAR